MRKDAFSSYHPVVNFVFFVGAIGFGVVIQHPAYLIAGCVGAAVYYLLLKGKKGIRTILSMIPVFLLISGLNPIFNTYGKHKLFCVFGRPYTLEVLCYGMVLGGMFVLMMLWFGCYSEVLTSDKFTSLFGGLIPALSLLLVMVLRLIPSFVRKTKQISGCRKSIGKGVNAQNSIKEKMGDGMTVLSALTDWALEGSIVTSDSMRARGYGAAKRSSFQIYRMTVRDWLLLTGMAVLITLVLLAGGTHASFTPVMSVSPLSWGFVFYCMYILIPSVIEIKEALQWRILLSRI